MRPAILLLLLFCCATALGQTNTPPPSDPKPKAQDEALGVGSQGKDSASVDILSDTQGVNFGPYLEEAVAEIRENWHRLIPESAASKKGTLAIEFAITKEGQVAAMRLLRKGDISLDRAAWRSIVACNPFKRLPDKFNGPYLALRVRFHYNDYPDQNEKKSRSN